MQDLTVALVQTSLHWHQREANLAMFEEYLSHLEDPVDFVLLPEMFTTGFTMEAKKLAEPPNFTTLRWMKQMAQKHEAAICGSFIINDGGNFFNRLHWVLPDGTIETYDKKHLFAFAGEDKVFSPGEKSLTVNWKGWKLKPMVCYDLRFPVWCRNRFKDNQMDYDVILFVANWPEARVKAWELLLAARAVENSAYAIGLNRVGIDGNGISYCGHSGVYNPKGEAVAELKNKEGIVLVNMNKTDLVQYRSKFRVQYDWDDFSVL
jgi:predicted amidohydrolase